MEKNIHFSLQSVVAKFRSVQKESLDPNALWRIVLWGGVVGILAVGALGYTAYNWALEVETPTVTSRGARDTFSLSELQSVISQYHQKEVNFDALLKQSPQPPSYERLKGIQSTDTPIPSVDDLDGVLPSTPTRTQ